MTSISTSVELVRALYEAFGRGDIQFVLDRIASDCRWVEPGEGIPYSGVYTGPEGVADFFRKLSESEQIVRFEPREFFVNGDDVVALGFEECLVPATGKKASTSWAMRFRVRDGKVVAFEGFYDTAAYLRAHRG